MVLLTLKIELFKFQFNPSSWNHAALNRYKGVLVTVTNSL